jgi:pilus assembly protein Flp/PilA
MLYLFSLFNSYLSSFKREEGQGIVEYGLIIALIAVVIIAAMAVLSPGITGIFGDIVAELTLE